jgi:hypothetical protein
VVRRLWRCACASYSLMKTGVCGGPFRLGLHFLLTLTSLLLVIVKAQGAE